VEGARVLTAIDMSDITHTVIVTITITVVTIIILIIIIIISLVLANYSISSGIADKLSIPFVTHAITTISSERSRFTNRSPIADLIY
jgi:heme/copper-type cytochrome/quinol oxidase subunit 2